MSDLAPIADIFPRSSTDRLKRDHSNKDLQREFDAELVAAVVGMSRAFMARALDRPKQRPKTFTLTEVLQLLDVDGFQETFIPRSRIPHYLLEDAGAPRNELPFKRPPRELGSATLQVGDARELLPHLDARSVQAVVTSSPYWGMRNYEGERHTHWADGEVCPYGFEQTPEGFIRHTVELLYLLKPAVAKQGSVWWVLMDTFNTRTPIRDNARARLKAMSEESGSRKGWTEHKARRHSAGHMYLDDGELCSIPPRIAERASRIGYKLKSVITWRKHASTPEPLVGRVSRQAECILHLAVDSTPHFSREEWKQLAPELGGPHPTLESAKKVTDVWSLPTSTGRHHGAEFPLALAGRCIALTTNRDDLVLDPFVGSGTTAMAALELGRRCLGYDISEKYADIAEKRIEAVRSKLEAEQGQAEGPLADVAELPFASAAASAG